jgi:hypothetical protein
MPLDLGRVIQQNSQMFRSQSRFVALIDHTGKPVCAPVWVEFADLPYVASDSEFESTAMKIALADGLLRADQKGSIRTCLERPVRAP